MYWTKAETDFWHQSNFLALNMNIIDSTFYSVFCRDAVDKKVQFFNVQQLERLTEQLQQVYPVICTICCVYM